MKYSLLFYCVNVFEALRLYVCAHRYTSLTAILGQLELAGCTSS